MHTYRTFVYVDARNVHGWTRREVNVPQIAHALCGSFRDLGLSGVKYFTGLATADFRNDARLKEIARLRFMHDQNVRTYWQDLTVDERGRHREVGIDTMLDAEMIEDFLYRGVDGFVLMSDDYDHQPTISLLQSLAKHQNRNIRIVHATHRSANFPRTVPFKVSENLIGRYAADIENAITGGLANLPSEQELDATRFNSAKLIPVPRTEEATGGKTACIIDLQSIGTSAKRALARQWLDCDLVSLIKAHGAQMERHTAAMHVVSCVHDPAFDVNEHFFTRTLLNDLAQADVTIDSLPCRYKSTPVAKDDRGPGRDIPISAAIPHEKGVHGTVLSAAARYAASKNFDTIVIMSDDPNLWPAAQLIRRIAARSGKPIRVVHAHFDPAVHAYHGAHNEIIPSNIYEQYIEVQSRYDRVNEMRKNHLVKDFQKLREQVSEALTGKVQHLDFDGQTPSGVGEFIGNTAHWSAFYDGRGTVHMFQSKYLPIQPTRGVVYDVRDKGMSIGRLGEPEHHRHEARTIL